MSKLSSWPSFEVFFRFLMCQVGIGRGRDEYVTRMLARAVAENRDVSLLCEAFSRDSWHWREPALGVMAARIAEGVPFEQAAVESRHALRPETRLALELGTMTDTLPETLDLAAYVVSDKPRASEIDRHNQAFYLVSVGFAMCCIVSFIMYYIIPKFKKIFEGFGVELPLPTVALIHVSDNVVNYFYLYVIGAVLAVCYWLRSYSRFWNQGRFPWLLSFGARARRATPNLLRLLAIAAERAVPWPQYMQALIDQPLPGWLRRSLTKVAREIETGHKPWPSLAKHGWLNTWEVSALEQSERAGNTIWTLRELANTRELRGRFRQNIQDEVLKPLVIVIVAVAVGFAVIALFLPIVKLISDLS
jgi:type II secretory pathway component PulF